MYIFAAATAGKCGICATTYHAGEKVTRTEDDLLVVIGCCGDLLDEESNEATDQSTKLPPVMPRGKSKKDMCPRCFQIPASSGVCGCAD